MIKLSCDRCKCEMQPVVYHPLDYISAELCEACYVQYRTLKKMQEDKTFGILEKWLNNEDVGPIESENDWFFRFAGVIIDQEGTRTVKAKIGL